MHKLQIYLGFINICPHNVAIHCDVMQYYFAMAYLHNWEFTKIWYWQLILKTDLTRAGPRKDDLLKIDLCITEVVTDALSLSVTMTPGNTDSGPARSQACNTLTVKLCPSYRHTHLSMRQSTTRTAYKFLEYGSRRGTMQGITYIRGVDFDESQRSYQIRILSWQGNYSTLGILAETCCRLCLFSNSRTE